MTSPASRLTNDSVTTLVADVPSMSDRMEDLEDDAESLDPYQNTMLSELSRDDPLFKLAAIGWGGYTTCNPHFVEIYKAWQTGDSQILATALRDNRAELMTDLEDVRPYSYSRKDVWAHHILTDLMHRKASEDNWKHVRHAEKQMLDGYLISKEDQKVDVHTIGFPERTWEGSQISSDASRPNSNPSTVIEFSKYPQKPFMLYDGESFSLNGLKPVDSVCDLMMEAADHLCRPSKTSGFWEDKARRSVKKTIQALESIMRNGGQVSDLAKSSYHDVGQFFRNDISRLRNAHVNDILVGEEGEGEGKYGTAAYILRHLTGLAGEEEWKVLPTYVSYFSDGRYTLKESPTNLWP